MDIQDAIRIFIEDTECSVSHIPMCYPDELPCGHNVEHEVRLFLEKQKFNFCILCSKDYTQEQVKANEVMRKNIAEFRDKHHETHKCGTHKCGTHKCGTHKLKSYQVYSVKIQKLIEQWKIKAYQDLENSRIERDEQITQEIKQGQKDIKDVIDMYQVLEKRITYKNKLKIDFCLIVLSLAIVVIACQFFF